MKTTLLHAVLPLTALAFVSSAIAASGPTVIPGGNVNDTYTISDPGSYLLGGNRVMTDASKHAIKITAHDVTLDLGGFALSYSAATNYRGVYIQDCENVEVRNGTIAKAFAGVDAQSGKGLRVVNVRIVSPGWAGAQSFALQSYFDRVSVSDAPNYGILTFGQGTLVTDCSIHASGAGISVDAGSRVVRSVVHGGTVGITLGFDSTATDCSVRAASQQGIKAGTRSILRDVDVMISPVGVYVPANAGAVIMGSRITGGVQGAYTDGGHNVIQ